MTYKIVKNKSGEVIAYGPNDGMYEPNLGPNDVLIFADATEGEALIKLFNDKIKAKLLADETAITNAKNSALIKLAALGLTEDEAKAILG